MEASQTADDAAAAASEADADSADSTQTEIDIANLREQINDAAQSAAARAELEAVRRQVGHIPNVQRRLDALEKSLQNAPSADAISEMNERLDRLVIAMRDVIDPAVAETLRSKPGDSNAAVLARMAALEDAVRNPAAPADEEPVDPAIAALQAGWAQAEDQAFDYARSKGMEPTDIPQSVWALAFNADPSNPVGGLMAVMKHIDGEVAKAGRRSDRADAAAGGAASGTASRKGLPTLEQLKEMPLSEVVKISKEDRDRIAANG